MHLSSKEGHPSRTQLPKHVLYRQRCGTAAIWGNNKRSFCYLFAVIETAIPVFLFFFKAESPSKEKTNKQLLNGSAELLHKDPLCALRLLWLNSLLLLSLQNRAGGWTGHCKGIPKLDWNMPKLFKKASVYNHNAKGTQRDFFWIPHTLAAFSSCSTPAKSIFVSSQKSSSISSAAQTGWYS